VQATPAGTEAAEAAGAETGATDEEAESTGTEDAEAAAKPAWSVGMPRPQRLRADAFDEQPTLPISPPQEALQEPPAPAAPRRVSADDTDALIADVASELIAFGEAQQREREAAEIREQQKSATATGEFVTQDPVPMAVPLQPKGLPLQGQTRWLVGVVVGVAALVTVLMLWLWPAEKEEAPQSSETVAQARPKPAPAPDEQPAVVAPATTDSDGGAEGTDGGTATGTGTGTDEQIATDQDATDEALAGEASHTKKPKKKKKRRRSSGSSDKPAPSPKKQEPAKPKKKKEKKPTKPSSSAESRVIAACKRGDKKAAKAALKQIPLLQRRPVKKRCKELGVKL
jgi:hypothetical protein